jgi:DNA-binding transcriptional regulator LsrR (DeoR family)
MYLKKRNVNGERNRVHRLSDVQVAEIRLRYSQGGVKQRELAEEFGVGQQLVSMIVAGKRRAKVTMWVVPRPVEHQPTQDSLLEP